MTISEVNRFFLCDVKRNQLCTKEGCIFHGGPCMMTTNPDYAWRIGKDMFSHEELMDWASEMWGESNVDEMQRESGEK